MPIHIVRLGSPRLRGEGLRIGTVRRPPRGVRKTDYASLNYYDVWLPLLAPSAATVKMAQAAASEREWQRYARKYRSEMAKPEARMVLELLAALSHTASFSVGCYCENEARCHRSILRELLRQHGAVLA